uniref:Ribosomal protein S16 n=1 Tax=Spumella sp. NIES-1846 TaxID=2490549 RepID=A0A455RF28_9STRA|nr:ribosomal protein S16 [Spumella sp. NIES-1846]
MLKIRLKILGTPKNKIYKIIVLDTKKNKIIKKLGNYNAQFKYFTCNKIELLKYLNNGAYVTSSLRYLISKYYLY